MQAFDCHIELDFDEADRCHSCDLSALVLGQQLGGRDILRRAALKEAQDRGEDRAAYWAEDMDIASMTARLCRNVRHAIATDDITTEKVSLGKSQLNLRPSGHVIRSVADLEREVPNHSPVRLLTFIRVLTHATFISL